MRICNKCKLEKEEKVFNLSSRRKDNLDTQCKECRSNYKKSRKDKDNIRRRLYRSIPEIKEKINIQQANYSKNNPEWYLYTKAKERAKNKNLEFNIEISDITIPEYCPLLETKLSKGKFKHYQDSPSLDRIDSTKGYIKGNIRVISVRANTMKNSANRELLEVFSKNILTYIDQKDSDIV